MDAKPEKEHVLQVRLRARSARTLMDLVHREGVDFNCGGVIPEPDGSFVLDVFVPASRLDALKVADITTEVVCDATVVGRERMREVATGNRFADGKRVPRGLGTKVRPSHK
jgi:hypothetical protein